MRLPTIVLVLTSLCCTPAVADFINGNFESPSVANSATAGSPVWTQSGSSDSGVWNIVPGYVLFNAEAPEGTQIGYSNNPSMAQQSSRLLTQDPVTLYAFAGRRADAFAGSYRMELWAGGTVASGAVTGGTLLSSFDFNHTLLAPSSFVEIQTSYTPTVGDPLIGQLLSARFVRTAGTQMNMDRVSFEAIPEPSSVTVFALAGLVAACRRGIRRAA
jgi:hypothetical protein